MIKYALYPLTLLLAMIATDFLITNGYSVNLALALVLVTVNALIWIFEFILPYELSWRPSFKTLGVDIIHTLMGSKVITPVIKLGLLFVINQYQFFHLGIWPHEWPKFLQVILAIVIADFSIYLAHRWMHKTTLGWKLHIIHHTPSKLHFWASARSHPLNVLLVFSLEVGILLSLGIGQEVLAIWTVFMSVNGLFEHCNIDLKPGFLNHVLATCVVHRIHHSTDWKESNTNFGNTTMLWDKVFGTFYLPGKEIRDVGIKNHQIPENYWDHIKAPFILDRYKKVKA
jgi:sterol desaturase/sphingolipid hydroxylase (fatty acid hydroxylase superfamily)